MKTFSKCPHRSPMAISEAIEPIIKNKVVCELGCAEGDNMVFMARYAKEVIGLEYDSERYDAAIKRGLNVVVGDWYECEFPKADVYYFWPNDGVKDNPFLVEKIYSNEDFKGTIIVAGDSGFIDGIASSSTHEPCEVTSVKQCVEIWGGELMEVDFDEGNRHRENGTFILGIIKK